MIKVEFTKDPFKENLPKYPYIGISKMSVIVLFTKPGTGLCLSNPAIPISNCWEEGSFVYYQGEITISNN